MNDFADNLFARLPDKNKPAEEENSNQDENNTVSWVAYFGDPPPTKPPVKSTESTDEKQPEKKPAAEQKPEVKSEQKPEVKSQDKFDRPDKPQPKINIQEVFGPQFQAIGRLSALIANMQGATTLSKPNAKEFEAIISIADNLDVREGSPFHTAIIDARTRLERDPAYQQIREIIGGQAFRNTQLEFIQSSLTSNSLRRQIGTRMGEQVAGQAIWERYQTASRAAGNEITQEEIRLLFTPPSLLTMNSGERTLTMEGWAAQVDAIVQKLRQAEAQDVNLRGGTNPPNGFVPISQLLRQYITSTRTSMDAQHEMLGVLDVLGPDARSAVFELTELPKLLDLGLRTRISFLQALEQTNQGTSPRANALRTELSQAGVVIIPGAGNLAIIDEALRIRQSNPALAEQMLREVIQQADASGPTEQQQQLIRRAEQLEQDAARINTQLERWRQLPNGTTLSIRVGGQERVVSIMEAQQQLDTMVGDLMVLDHLRYIKFWSRLHLAQLLNERGQYEQAGQLLTQAQSLPHPTDFNETLTRAIAVNNRREPFAVENLHQAANPAQGTTQRDRDLARFIDPLNLTPQHNEFARANGLTTGAEQNLPEAVRIYREIARQLEQGIERRNPTTGRNAVEELGLALRSLRAGRDLTIAGNPELSESQKAGLRILIAEQLQRFSLLTNVYTRLAHAQIRQGQYGRDGGGAREALEKAHDVAKLLLHRSGTSPSIIDMLRDEDRSLRGSNGQIQAATAANNPSLANHLTEYGEWTRWASNSTFETALTLSTYLTGRWTQVDAQGRPKVDAQGNPEILELPWAAAPLPQAVTVINSILAADERLRDNAQFMAIKRQIDLQTNGMRWNELFAQGGAMLVGIVITSALLRRVSLPGASTASRYSLRGLTRTGAGYAMAGAEGAGAITVGATAAGLTRASILQGTGWAVGREYYFADEFWRGATCDYVLGGALYGCGRLASRILEGNLSAQQIASRLMDAGINTPQTLRTCMQNARMTVPQALEEVCTSGRATATASEIANWLGGTESSAAQMLRNVRTLLNVEANVTLLRNNMLQRILDTNALRAGDLRAILNDLRLPIPPELNALANSGQSIQDAATAAGKTPQQYLEDMFRNTTSTDRAGCVRAWEQYVRPLMTAGANAAALDARLLASIRKVMGLNFQVVRPTTGSAAATAEAGRAGVEGQIGAITAKPTWNVNTNASPQAISSLRSAYRREMIMRWARPTGTWALGTTAGIGRDVVNNFADIQFTQDPQTRELPSTATAFARQMQQYRAMWNDPTGRGTTALITPVAMNGLFGYGIGRSMMSRGRWGTPWGFTVAETAPNMAFNAIPWWYQVFRPRELPVNRPLPAERKPLPKDVRDFPDIPVVPEKPPANKAPGKDAKPAQKVPDRK